MLKRFGGGVEVDVEGRPAAEVEMGNEGSAEGRLIDTREARAIQLAGGRRPKLSPSHLASPCGPHHHDAKLAHRAGRRRVSSRNVDGSPGSRSVSIAQSSRCLSSRPQTCGYTTYISQYAEAIFLGQARCSARSFPCCAEIFSAPQSGAGTVQSTQKWGPGEHGPATADCAVKRYTHSMAQSSGPQG